MSPHDICLSIVLHGQQETDRSLVNPTMSDSEQAAACRRVLESTIAMRISARQ
eukprot:COSAG01_NODE_23212_length_823_cov_57.595304_1_plen_52_part_10